MSLPRRSRTGAPRWVLLAGLLILVSPQRGTVALRINTSPSLPLGIYVLAETVGPRVEVALRPGDLVLACPPGGLAGLALARRYLRRGTCPCGTKAVGKLVLAAAGDRLTMAEDAITLDGCRLPASASQARDTVGRALPHVRPGTYLVPGGQVWLFSPHPRSWDSRYFGPVRTDAVEGRLRPLLTMPAPELDLPGAVSRLRGCSMSPVKPVPPWR